MRDLSSASAETEKCNSGRFLQLFCDGFHLPCLRAQRGMKGAPGLGDNSLTLPRFWQHSHTRSISWQAVQWAWSRNPVCGQSQPQCLGCTGAALWGDGGTVTSLRTQDIFSWALGCAGNALWFSYSHFSQSWTATSTTNSLGNCWGSIKAQSNFLEKHQSTWMKYVAIILLSCCIVCTVNCGLGGKQAQREGTWPQNNPAA